MLFRQFIDPASSSYTYLLASGPGREAVLIDPVRDRIAQYLTAIEQLELKLVRAIDTHTHADHITALGTLRERTGCASVMGEYTKAECVTERVVDGQVLDIDGVRLEARYTPGHTDESFSFVLPASTSAGAVFTGDALLIRGSGRTDFQNGDAGRSWDSIQLLLRLPDATRVYPGHDYNGWTMSTIGEERRFNPRIAGKTRAQYIEIMRNLHIPRPKLMDVAVPANRACGLTA